MDFSEPIDAFVYLGKYVAAEEYTLIDVLPLVPRQYRQPPPAFRKNLIRQPEKHRRCGNGHTTVTVKPRVACQNVVRCPAQRGFGVIN
jgi:hypothetical protein